VCVQAGHEIPARRSLILEAGMERDSVQTRKILLNAHLGAYAKYQRT
jgi:hypothetical protein